jgi:hypothetical protein
MLLETSIYNYGNLEETILLKNIEVELKPKKNKKSKSITIKNNVDSKIENFIKKSFKDYSKCSVKKVLKCENEKDITYYVEIDDNFCMNVNRNHTSSNIYFQIKSSGICQRCYCKKETIDGRLHGMCKEYASKEISLNKILKKELFGTETVSKKNKSIVTFNVTKHTTNAKESCLLNCKTILLQIENELL